MLRVTSLNSQLTIVVIRVKIYSSTRTESSHNEFIGLVHDEYINDQCTSTLINHADFPLKSLSVTHSMIYLNVNSNQGRLTSE